MKNSLFLVIFLMFSITSFAQTDLTGTWTGKAVKNGQPMGFKLEMLKDRTFSMAYDLNPNDLSVKGSWASSRNSLSFKGTDEELQLKRMSKRSKPGKGAFTMKFRKGKKVIIYGFNIGMPPTAKVASFFGWDEGVAAVVVNHEEQW